MTAQDALKNLAQTSHTQAASAIADAQAELCGALDAKVAEIAAFRAQVTQQTKQLRDLMATSRQRQKKLANPQIAQLTESALDVQGKIEQINQRVRVLEDTQRRIELHASK